jgi:hypothetical protein
MSKSHLTIHDFQSINLGSSIPQFTAAGSSITLDSSNSGDYISLNTTSGSAITLPPPVTGLNFPFVVTAVGPHTITSPISGNIYGSLACAIPTIGSSLLTSNGGTVISTTSGSLVGDRINIVSDGANYYVSGTVGRFNALKFN